MNSAKAASLEYVSAQLAVREALDRAQRRPRPNRRARRAAAAQARKVRP